MRTVALIATQTVFKTRGVYTYFPKEKIQLTTPLLVTWIGGNNFGIFHAVS